MFLYQVCIKLPVIAGEKSSDRQSFLKDQIPRIIRRRDHFHSEYLLAVYLQKYHSYNLSEYSVDF